MPNWSSARSSRSRPHRPSPRLRPKRAVLIEHRPSQLRRHFDSTAATAFRSVFVGMKTRFVGIEATPPGFEPGTPSLEGWCSIRLSYGVMPSRQVYPRRRSIERCAAGFARLTWTKTARPRDGRHCRFNLRRFDRRLHARRALAGRRCTRLSGQDRRERHDQCLCYCRSGARLGGGRRIADALARGHPLGPIDGVRATIKDNIWAQRPSHPRRGSTTTDAMPAQANSPAVARVAGAGDRAGVADAAAITALDTFYEGILVC
jgi:hypothetical protein